MIAGDHHRTDAGAFRRVRPPPSPRPAADRSCRSGPATPDPVRVRRQDARRALRSASPASQRPATPSVRSASPASASLVCENLRAARRCQRPAVLADEFERAAREQHVGRALGEHDASVLSPSVSPMDRAHQLALGRERHFADPRQALVERLRAEARLAGGNEQRPFRRIALHGPPPSRSCRTALFARSATARRARVRCAARRRSRRHPRAEPPRRRVAGALEVTRPLAVTTMRTVISFFVSVPVLSDAMTLAEPSVSTAARCRTMALRCAMRCTPIESTAVTTAGSPSGTAATASATPRISTRTARRGPARLRRG